MDEMGWDRDEKGRMDWLKWDGLIEKEKMSE